MKNAFPYPLTTAVLEAFCHPCAGHILDRPYYYKTGVLASNGWIAILCHRGLWLDSDYHEAPPEIAGRADKYDWTAPAKIRADLWTDFDRISATIKNANPPALWMGDSLAPSPVWLLGPVKIRLSVLAFIARLPKLEISLNGTNSTWFRFTGGTGVIPADPKIYGTAPSRSLMQPQQPII